MSDRPIITGAEAETRRRYWAAEMDAAVAFMAKARETAVTECGEPLCSAPDAAAAGDAEVAFNDAAYPDGSRRSLLLREDLIPPLLAAAAEMNQRGWILRIEDGYRNRHTQRNLGCSPTIMKAILDTCVWECGGNTPPTELVYKRFSALVATYPANGTHMSGSAIDISVIDRDTGEKVDRGAPYLGMSELTPMASPFISATARQNRQAITELMARHGFVAYPYEFWHYSSDDIYAALLSGGRTRARYGPVDCCGNTGAVNPLDDPDEPLIRPEHIVAALEPLLKDLA